MIRPTLSDTDARACVREIEDTFWLARTRRLTNAEIVALAEVSSALARRAEAEASVRVAEYPSSLAATYW